MNKYMLTIQHDDQKVAYIEFKSENDDQAKITGENIFRNYATEESFIPRYPVSSGNFTGLKPRIKSHYVSKWNSDVNALNANGRPCGGYWSSVLV